MSSEAISGDSGGASAGHGVIAVPVPVSDALTLPHAAAIGSYGGGDGLRLARSILLVDLPPTCVPESVRTAAWESAERVHAEWAATDPDDRIARLPASLPAAASLRWQCRLHISSHVYGGEDAAGKANVMCQGLLFHDVVTDPSRSGEQRWPLVGMFDAVGLADSAEGAGAHVGDAAAVGWQALRPSDQHVHRDALEDVPEEVRAFIPWDVGSDMSRFRVEPGALVAKAWLVCIDLDSRIAEASLLLMVAGELEAKVDAAAAACAVEGATGGGASQCHDLGRLLHALVGPCGGGGGGGGGGDDDGDDGLMRAAFAPFAGDLAALAACTCGGGGDTSAHASDGPAAGSEAAAAPPAR